jgi:hypothetical protein
MLQVLEKYPERFRPEKDEVSRQIWMLFNEKLFDLQGSYKTLKHSRITIFKIKNDEITLIRIHLDGMFWDRIFYNWPLVLVIQVSISRMV